MSLPRVRPCKVQIGAWALTELRFQFLGTCLSPLKSCGYPSLDSCVWISCILLPALSDLAS